MNFDVVEPAETRSTLLFVTGDADLRAVAARVLGREGYNVLTAAHSGHALLACLTGRIDILVAEVALEDTTGPALAATLQRHQPGLRAVYLADAGTAPAEGVIVRPFTRDDLVLQLESAGMPVTSAS
jgi:DNA-binding NtrC family response regulator